MHQTVCTSLVLNILAFTLLFTILKYSVTRCYMKGLLCNIVRAYNAVNGGAISLNGNSPWRDIRTTLVRKRERRRMIRKKKETPVRVLPVKKTNAFTITNCFFLSYERSDARISFSCVIVKSKTFFFSFIRVGYPRAPSKIRSFICSSVILPNQFPHCACPRWRCSVGKLFWEVP